MREINILGVDLAKKSFQIHGINKIGRVVLKKQLDRSEFMKFIDLNISTNTLIAMESCASSNYWGRVFKNKGYEVKLIAAKFVKPFVKSQKNDRNDAEAIAEAASRPSMRFVPLKETWQQDLQLLHRRRQRLIQNKVALTNQIHSFLLEYGVVIPLSKAKFAQNIYRVMDEKNELTDSVKVLLRDMIEEYGELLKKIESYTKNLESISEKNPLCARLKTIPGIGPLTSTAMIASVGDAREFNNGRNLSAWLGVVPKQMSTGGRTRLLGITKRGDVYLRSLMVHGARSSIKAIIAKQKKDPLSEWILKKVETKGYNGAAVALANKNARIAWALLTKEEDFKQVA